jgi:hypothetical protein
MAARKPVLRRLRGVWRYRCRQVVTAERHLYGDRDPVLETSKLPNSAGDRWFESNSLQRDREHNLRFSTGKAWRRAHRGDLPHFDYSMCDDWVCQSIGMLMEKGFVS